MAPHVKVCGEYRCHDLCDMRDRASSKSECRTGYKSEVGWPRSTPNPQQEHGIPNLLCEQTWKRHVACETRISDTEGKGKR
ncbi:hypothetical protein PISMIDRAFT_685895 [Pisolithus microcarpus 441]|uniref:Uncharacterized protein n=1 Tax=Pisolithus microcarpus 441 TaxID=765257 RepID=A0A0C9YJM8_9AGAM|nr:hypothetical protein PISMIDRAFT_685895 [Pisolithus microcarpus 441]